MEPILSMQTWLSLSNETRNRIRKDLGIKKSGHVEVFDGHVLCDGTMMEDLAELTLAKMQEYVGSNDKDFHKVFLMMIDFMEKPPEEMEITILPKVEAIKAKRKYERRKKNKQK